MYKRIIDIIVDFSHGNKWTLKQLSEKYHISIQSIRNDIHNINMLLDEYNFEKIEIKKGWILCPDNFTEIKRYVNQKLASSTLYSYRLSKEESLITTTLILIFQNGYITIDQLSEKLLIGRTTLFERMHSIRHYAESIGLTIFTSSNKGMVLKNTENEKRTALIRLLNQTVMENEFLLNLILKINLLTSHDNRKMIEYIIYEVQVEFQITFPEHSFRILNYYLTFAIQRMQEFNYVVFPTLNQNSPSYQYAQKIMAYVSRFCNVPIIASETSFLSDMLNDSIHYSSLLQNPSLTMPVQLLTSILIKNVSNQINIDLSPDFQLYENLSNHLLSIQFLRISAILKQLLSKL